MSTNGRPPALDEAKKAEILALVKTGCGKLAAANAVNCHPQTITNTARRDPEFAKQLAQAQNAAMLAHLENVNRASCDVKYWRASAWVLERLNPATFAKAAPDAVAKPQQEAILKRLAEALVEEIPVARHRQQAIKRFNKILQEEAALFENA